MKNCLLCKRVCDHFLVHKNHGRSDRGTNTIKQRCLVACINETLIHVNYIPLKVVWPPTIDQFVLLLHFRHSCCNHLWMSKVTARGATKIIAVLLICGAKNWFLWLCPTHIIEVYRSCIPKQWLKLQLWGWISHEGLAKWYPNDANILRHGKHVVAQLRLGGKGKQQQQQQQQQQQRKIRNV